MNGAVGNTTNGGGFGPCLLLGAIMKATLKATLNETAGCFVVTALVASGAVSLAVLRKIASAILQGFGL